MRLKRSEFLMRKFFSVLICALFAGALMACATSAYANNHQDKYYAVSSSGHGYTWTPSEKKTDTTSSWNNCTGCNGTHNAEIAAQSSYNGKVHFVGSPKYAWWTGKTGYMYNNVKERGYNYATLWISGSPYVSAQGLWSPDSV